ncbi:MAG: bacteriorhodopsin [Verrucomicrobiota bacterium]
MIPELSGLQMVVHYTFIMTFIGMIAGCIFFALQKSSVLPEYQTSMTVTAVILAIASINYYYMKDVYVMGIATGEGNFPTEFRYIDWMLTVPLMLVKFPVLLGMGPKGTQFLVILVMLSLLMLVTGFIGEVSPETPLVHYGLFGVGVVAWLLIVGMIFFSLSDLPPHIDEITAGTIKKMAYFILIGWLIYPIGYLSPTIGLTPDIRELVYNIGDLINKVGLGLFIYYGSAAKTKLIREYEAAQYDQNAYEAQT